MPRKKRKKKEVTPAEITLSNLLFTSLHTSHLTDYTIKDISTNINTNTKKINRLNSEDL